MDNCVEVNQHFLASPGQCGRLGVTTKKPKFARYAILSNREESFKAWPQYIPLGKEGLIEAGLVYTGVGDSVRCYHCGGGLRNWEAGDKPMIEHAKWYPECAHVLLVKGQEYIDAAGRGEDLDEINASRHNYSVPSTNKDNYKPDIKCVAAQSCLDMGYQLAEVETAMSKFITQHGNDNFKASDVLEIILDARDQEVEMTGACDVADCQAEANDDKAEEYNKEVLEKMKDENQRIKERQLCKICLEDRSSIIFLPCGHLVACPQCAPALFKCPMCRLEVQGQVRAHFA